ncbi:hypothetical protein GCM10022224_005190 [Nonomuraea antimicrobica]|uniref:Gram-positive cocci surface proteins LPxTG domain-containing protein n=1 Tax=Nonomuraea antimicrobica TaxID=561173 RepID=A0ABP7B0P3_9ACTN
MVLPNVPASAAPADLSIEYKCVAIENEGSIVRHGPVWLTTNLAFATDLTVGDPLNLTWKLGYDTAEPGRLQAPGYFATGGQVHATGYVEHRKDEVNVLMPRGVSDAHGPLRPDDPLTPPQTLSDPALTDEAGVITITPGDIELDFTPPDGVVVVNDGDDADNPSDLRIVYSDDQWESRVGRPESENHKHNDLHEASQKDASATLTFVGTNVRYMGPTDKDSSPVDVFIDDKKVATVNPSRDADDNPVNDDLDGGKILYDSPTLKYGEHTIRLVKAAEEGLMWLDSFEVSTTAAKTPTGYHAAKCSPVGAPTSVEVTVRPKPDPTDTSTDDPDDPGQDDPGDSTPPADATVGGDQVIVLPQSSTSSSTSSTPKSTGPTATNYYKAQVANTPSGGVETGVAPDAAGHPYGLMAGGMAVVLGSAGGGLLLRRRQAGHAGGTR